MFKIGVFENGVYEGLGVVGKWVGRGGLFIEDFEGKKPKKK